MMSKNLLVLFAFLILNLIGCASQKKTIKPADLRRNFQWETKALIKDDRAQKTHNLSIDLYLIKNQKARFEVSALLGYQVASLVVAPQEMSLVIYPQKIYYHGKNPIKVVKHFVDLPIHPMYLSKLALDEPLTGLDWVCRNDDSGLVSQCENSKRQIEIRWLDRQEGQKKIVIKGPQFEMQWQFKSLQTEVQFKSELFFIKPPAGFKAVQIN